MSKEASEPQESIKAPHSHPEISFQPLQTFQQLVVRQPVKKGGMGIKSTTQLRLAAFIGAVEQSVPTLGLSTTGLCPQLSTIYGGDECFSKRAPKDTRWRVLMEAGSRLGVEFRQAWEEMQLEGRQCAEWLGKELDGGLAEPVVGAGQGSTSGGTKKVIVEQLGTT